MDMKLLIILIFACLFPAYEYFNGGISDAPPFTVNYIAVGKDPGSVESADMNGDHIPDLLVANTGDSSITVLLSKGKGRFVEAKGSPFRAGAFPNDVAITDINGDGKPDAVIANTERKYLTVLIGDGNGGLQPMPGSPFKVNVTPHVHGVATADFNGDGYTDLITDSWGNNRLEILFGNRNGFNPSGKIIEVGKHPYQRIRAADLDHNGTIDIVTTNLDGNNTTILLNDGKANFHEPAGSPFYCGDSPFGVAIGDLNHDGHPDLAIINSPTITSSNTGRDGLSILLGGGSGRFTAMAGSPFKTGKSPGRIAMGDINGDGYTDVAVANYNDNIISLYYLHANGIYKQFTVPTDKHTDGICLTDVDGDGKAEIICSYYEKNRIGIIKMR
jgi:hypothetical protein